MIHQLVDQLGALLKGRGLNRGPLVGRLAPELRRALDLPDTLPELQVRVALREALEAAARGLPPDLADTFLAAAGITSQARLLEERLMEVGEQQHRGLRTMRRRLDEAKLRIVESLAATTPADAGPDDPIAHRGWTFEDFALTLDLTHDLVQFTAHRTIVALRDGLTEVTELFSLPERDVPQSLHVARIEGCTFAGVERQGGSSWSLRCRLPRPLARNQRHTYAVTVALAEARILHPSIHFVPLRECARFTATLVQGEQPRVRDLGRLDGVLPSDPHPARVPYDTARGAHLVTHSWDDPQPGLRYGLAWEWRD